MEAKIKGNDFGVFLSALGNAGRPSAPNVELPSMLLSYLLAHEDPVPVGEILEKTPVSIGSMASVLDTLSSAKLVQLTTVGTSERVQLTDIGRKVAAMGVVSPAADLWSKAGAA
jgi:DNA-binding MarR family transcriptional regulator